VKRFRFRKSGLLLITVVALAAIGSALGVMAAESGNPEPGLVTMSNDGVPITPSPNVSKVLVHTKTNQGQLRLLGEREGLSFYKMVGTDRGSCFGIGYGIGNDAALNLISCSIFPNNKEPVLDSSVFEFDKQSGVSRWDQVQGWAADGVASIAVLDEAANVVAEKTVTGNIYAITRSELAGTTATKILARDTSGATVFEKDVPSDGD
jgi:hypothetical protein